MLTISILAAIVIIFLFTKNFLKYNKNISKLGTVHFKWNERFDLSTFAGKYSIFAILLFIALIIHWYIYYRSENYGYTYIILFLLVFSFYPNWQIVFGKNGIIVHRQFIAWDVIKKCHFLENDTKLRVTYVPVHLEKTFRINPKFKEKCKDLMNEKIPDKLKFE